MNNPKVIFLSLNENINQGFSESGRKELLEFNILIKNGRVIDGTGNPWYKANMGICNGRIASIGALEKAEAKTIIDVSGLAVAPGFIDMHTHSDFNYLVNPRAESKIRQGVTTEVIGNCGSSAAPLTDTFRKRIMRTMPFLEEAGADLDWSTMAEYLQRLERQGVSLNVAPLVGHGTVRACVMGYEERAPTLDELAEMKGLVAEAMEAGAFGMSTGLIYTPGSYAETGEIIELCKTVAEYRGIYTSHIRGEERTLKKAVGEAIEIGETAGVPVEISHHKASGERAWGEVKNTLKMIESARNRGVDVTCDVYPYVATSFELSAMLPPWAHADEYGVVVERLKDVEQRRKMRRDMKRGLAKWSTPLKQTNWDKIMIASSPKNPKFEGKMIETIAKEKGADPFDLVFNLLVEENLGVRVIRFSINENDLQTVLKYPNSMIGSDGSSLAPYGPLGKGKPHPRNYGTFPRVLGRYVRQTHTLTLQDAIRKMTSLPAQKLKLRDRGLIREGSWADMVIFNAKEISDRATFAKPHQYPKGIEYVIVNGNIVVEHGKHEGILPGKVLRLN